ncbi:MAG: hypothetical protein JW937_00150 [Candidatus Omnitrophica bacterium]|nr:hypothetical protein [Candidatus Omnitrophota bacterium]
MESVLRTHGELSQYFGAKEGPDAEAFYTALMLAAAAEPAYDFPTQTIVQDAGRTHSENLDVGARAFALLRDRVGFKNLGQDREKTLVEWYQGGNPEEEVLRSEDAPSGGTGTETEHVSPAAVMRSMEGVIFGVEPYPLETMTQPEAQAFCRKVEAPVSLEGTEVLVPGHIVNRMTATVTIQSPSGALREVHFVSTVHDREAANFVYRDGYSLEGELTKPTDSEKSHIKEGMAAHPKARVLMVEEGNTHAESSLHGWILELSRDGSSLGNAVQEGLKTVWFENEMSYAVDHALSTGRRAVNVDIRASHGGLRAVYDELGLRSAAFYAYREISSHVFAWQVPMPEIAARWFQDLGIQVSLPAMRELYEEYEGIRDSEEDVRIENDMRDRHMAWQILNAEEDVLVVTHTRHAFGIIRALQEHMVSFDGGSVLRAAGQYSVYRTQALWARKGIKALPDRDNLKSLRQAEAIKQGSTAMSLLLESL